MQQFKTDQRKRSLYFPHAILEEIRKEATRQDRSISKIMQYAWTIAEKRIKKMPKGGRIRAA